MAAAHAPDNAAARQARARAAWVEETAAQLRNSLPADVLALLDAPNPVEEDEEEETPDAD